jgi:hypothetical protein
MTNAPDTPERSDRPSSDNAERVPTSDEKKQERGADPTKGKDSPKRRPGRPAGS